MRMRLDKLLAQNTPYSRSDIKKLLKKGRVTRESETLTDAAMLVDDQQVICIDGEAIACQALHYFMLYKPEGYVCAATDPQYPTVLQLIHEPCAMQLHMAGRLDLDTTGLVLLTNDGQWSHSITSPKRECAKQYWVETASPIDPETIALFAKGVQLHNEKELTRPAELEIVSATQAKLTIHEGKYHQVKRMFAAVGNHVTKLHRQKIGAIELDAKLRLGEYRRLTAHELTSI